MINSEIYQEIYDELSKYVSRDDSLIIYMEYGEASYVLEFYVKKADTITKCYDLPNVDEDELLDSFERLEALIAPEREKLEKKWSNMTVVITNEGDMHTDFDYTDLTDGNYDYMKAWKEKYLK